MKTRMYGHYWLNLGNTWRVAYWDGEGFLLPGWRGYQEDYDGVGPMVMYYPDDPSVQVPVEPSPRMIEEGAKAIVSWDEGCVWPDSWGSDARRHRTDAEKAYRAMIRAAQGMYSPDEC